MRGKLLLLFVLLGLSGVMGATKKLTAEEKHQRMIKNWVLINEYSSNNYITRVRHEDDFFKYLVRSPRNYTLIILFNSDRECYACRQVDTAFENVAVSYVNQLNTSNPRSAFFFRVQIEAMYGVSNKMSVQTVPALMYVPPVRGIGFPHKRHQFLYYPSATTDMDEYEITEFIKENTGVKIEGFGVRWNMKYVYIALVVSAIVLPFLYLLVTNPRGSSTWFYFCMVTFALNMGGTVGNAVHGNQWAQYNMITGEYIYINPGLMRQFQLEGYVASFLQMFASVCLISILHFVPRFKSSWNRRIMFFLLVVLMICSLNSWMALYCYKNRSYPFQYYFDWFELIQWFSATVHEYTRIAL